MKKILILFLCLMLLGCASPSIRSVNLYNKDLKFAPTNFDSVQFFLRKPFRESNFIEIGEITVEHTNWQAIEKILKTKAAELGGDVVYVINKSGQIQTDTYRDYRYDDVSYRNHERWQRNVYKNWVVTGLVVKYKN